jgi:3-hydroxyisobutyrate dehydrogenase-like beta-hydroxyacid dehydrogenase
VSTGDSVTVGWIGLGEMGLPMAVNLRRAGYRVLAHDIDETRLVAAEEAGVLRADSAAAAAAAADVVVTMLRTAAQTDAVLVGDGGLAASVPDGREVDVVVMSTLTPESMQQLAAQASGRLRIVDAPVSGGVRGAELGTLVIMAAGPPAALARARPLFDALGSSIFEVGGEPGLGQAVKLANQVMMTAALAGTTEALALSRAYGLEDEAVCAAVAAGTGSSWVLEHWPWMRSLWESYEPGGSLDILVKDVRALLAEADTRKVELPVTALAFSRLLETWNLHSSRK